MQPGWPLRSLIIYRKLGPTMGNLIFVSVELNSGILLRVVFELLTLSSPRSINQTILLIIGSRFRFARRF